MFHDQHVLTNGMYLPFHFLCPARAYYGYVQCGFIPSAVWRLSNYYFQLFRCRNLALNRFFLLFLRDRYVSHLGGHLYAPYVYTPHMFVHALTPPYVQIAPICPQCSHMHLCSREYLHVRWECGAPYVGHPLRGMDASPYVQHSPCIVCSPVSLYVLWAKHFLCLGSDGVSMSFRLLVSVRQTLDVHYASSCVFL